MSQPAGRLSEVMARVAEGKVSLRWRLFGPECDERRRRLWAGAEAWAHGSGGVALVARATGISPDTVRRGLAELEAGERLDAGRVRRPGGGRRPVSETDPGVVDDLERLLDPVTRGDRESLLRWTSKSDSKLAVTLGRMGHEISDHTVRKLLDGLGYRRHANSKTREGKDRPDRDAQFAHLNDTATAAVAAGQPVISVDSRQKALGGNFRSVGGEWRPEGSPIAVRIHDSKDLGDATPYGMPDIAADQGFVSVGTSAGTPQLSANSIRAWWEQLGRPRYPNATTLTITADRGGSSGDRRRIWETELQKLADDTRLQIEVCHFPPGTSKWNRIEHRLFSYIAQNWRGKPVIAHQVVIALIASTTSTGPTTYARFDDNDYPKIINVSAEKLAAVNIDRHSWHPAWNYRIWPTNQPR